jgi:hypothetical protein
LLNRILIQAIIITIAVHIVGCKSENGDSTSEAISSDVQAIWDLAGRDQVPDRWYEKAAAIKVVTLKKNMRYGYEISLNPDELSVQLDQIKAEGFQAIEIFAASHGVKAYNGLDVMNHYNIDPDLGNMDDFSRVVRMAHDKGIAVVVFVNIGYFSKDAPDWIEACKDKKAGRKTDKVKWFLWADNENAPIPPTQEDIYVTQQEIDETPTWGWQYSDLAGCYFWARWQVKDDNENAYPLPQNNWASEEWRQESEKIIRFWMATGIDGVLIDAPLCYPYQTWEHNKKHIVDVVASYGNTLIQPEGGRDAAWMTESRYNCIQDYGLYYELNTYKWVENDVISRAIKTGNPREIEENLQFYHDVMAQAGAVLYVKPGRIEAGILQKNLHRAVLAGIGDIISYTKYGQKPESEESNILKMKYKHPALHPVATRRKLTTNDDDKFYAILKTSKDGSERILAVFNFQSNSEIINVDVSVIATSGLVNLREDETIKRESQFAPLFIEMPAYGYKFYRVLPSVEER